MKKIFLFLLLFLVACGEREKPLLVERGFEDLPGWEQENVTGAYGAFQKSCEVLMRKDGALHDNPLFGRAIDWQALCRQLPSIEPGDLKAFLEQRLKVYEVLPEEGETPLFTGYYTPELEGSFRKRAGYDVPLYKVPQDLVTADLGLFDEELKGRRLVARVEGRKIIPYATRAEMEAHLKARDVLLWVKDPIDAFFLHIQGSGRVRLPDGRLVYVGYAENNGLDYTAIGRALVQTGALTLEEATMPGIRAWLLKHPEQREAIFNSNPRYIFFRELTQAPRGALGVDLTMERSLAVDRSVMPLGLPVFVASRVDADAEPFHQLMLAQDVGSAIKGRVRGDIYFGAGADAGRKAGVQRAGGRLFVFVPGR